MDGIPSSSHFPPATPHLAGGQSALKRLLRADADRRERSRAAGILWYTVALLSVLGQLGLSGFTIPTGGNAAILGGAILLGTLCIFAGPRTPQRWFVPAEQAMLVLVWPATAMLVARSGGAESPVIALYAAGVLYCAFFLAQRAAMAQILLATLAIWAPVAYDMSTAAGSGFIARAAVFTAAMWSVAVLVSRNRAALREAEMNARRMALTDPLTGVGNLRTFDGEFNEQLARAYETDDPFAIAFVDIDGLQAANTVHGHAGGDAIICRTAELLMQAAGSGDQVARIGGDEFAVLMPGAGRADAVAFEDCFSVMVKELNEADGYDGPPVGASVGSSVFPLDGEDLESLMRVADTRMHAAKAELPRMLPVERTPGGRRLTPDSELIAEAKAYSLERIAGPATGWAWAMGGGMIMVSALFDKTMGRHYMLSIALAAVCVAIATAIQLTTGERRERMVHMGDALAVPMVPVAIYATGSSMSIVLPLILLVVAHTSYTLPTATAAWRNAMLIGLMATPLLLGASVARFTPVAMFIGVAATVAMILQFNRAKLEAARSRAIEAANIDPLTGSANRRAFEAQLSHDAARHRAGATGGGLVLIDIDDFKAINTTSGHKGGDEILKHLSAVLEGAAARIGRVCRIGGDEFALVVSEGGDSDVQRAAALSRAAVQSVNWSGLHPPGVTVSVGYATWSTVDDWPELVVAADLALRHSKLQGKDRVSASEGSAATSKANRVA